MSNWKNKKFYLSPAIERERERREGGREGGREGRERREEEKERSGGGQGKQEPYT